MQVRVMWSALVVCALLTACAPPDLGPRPTGTLEPSITESSPEPPKPPPNDACKLLTSAEREDLMGMAMNAEVPIKPLNGTEECIWTRSLAEPARSAIRVVALEGRTWAQVARPQLVRAIAYPSTSRALVRKLRQALVEVSSAPMDLTDERICEIYLLYSEAYGLQRAEEMVFYGAIGAMPAVYAASCDDGRIVMAGFGEHGLRGSIAANHAAARLLEPVKERAAEVLRDAEAEAADEGTTGDEVGTDGTDDDESPSPEPTPNEEDEDSEDEEES